MMKSVEVSGNPIKMGNMLHVVNQKKHHSARHSYIALWVENVDGDEEECLLFLDEEQLNKTVDLDTLQVKLKPGRLYPIELGEVETNIISIRDLKQKLKMVRLSPSILIKARERATNNPEDIPQRSWLTDKLD